MERLLEVASYSAGPRHILHTSLLDIRHRCLWTRYVRLPCFLWVKINQVQKLTTEMEQSNLQLILPLPHLHLRYPSRFPERGAYAKGTGLPGAE